jgi:hypothetical protein
MTTLLPRVGNPSYSESSNYTIKSARPVLFFITQPGNVLQPLYDVCLALHVNPETLSESYTKTKNVTPTYGGFIEYHWPDELDSFSANGSTGTFITPKYGLSGVSKGDGSTTGRQETLAYERMQDLLDLFHNNGMIFDSNGKPAIRGRIAMILDRGVYYGHFGSFTVTEEANTSPFMFSLDWDFKVEQTIYKVKRTEIADLPFTPTPNSQLA